MILTTALLDKEMHKPIIRVCETNPGREKKIHTDIQILITNKSK